MGRRTSLFARTTTLLLLSLLLLVCVGDVVGRLSSDGEALLVLKSRIDPTKSLQWGGNDDDVCNWQGIKECFTQGRVTKLVLENFNLTGTLDERSLNELDQLRVLSFKQNAISGQIPNLSGLRNLKSLYLNNNNFSGNIPPSLSLLHRLKVVVLSANHISGTIPDSLLNLGRLYLLYLDDNRLTGQIPPLNQTSLRFLNLSNNQLSGEIPASIGFNASSFIGNMELCGQQVHIPCHPNPPSSSSSSSSSRHKHWKLVAIIAGSIGGFLLLCIFVVLLIFIASRRKKKKKNETREVKPGGVVKTEREDKRKQSFSWETGRGDGGGGGGGGVGSLVFLGGGDQPEMSYSLEELLKASAETLGRGTLGSTYKAVMESGYIVTVKRLKDARYPSVDDFRTHLQLIGSLRHPSLVPLRAYFQAKEERLLVYDYFPNGSLFSLIHGSRTSAGGKPLHWTSCLKIAEDLASGLLYIHQNPVGGLTHGNLKSSNVLLGSDFESCLTDFGLSSFRNPDSAGVEESSGASLFYRAPECRDRRPVTQQADVYSFGVLVLELLTGKTPFQDLVQQHGSDIPRWVRSVRRQEEGIEQEEEKDGDRPNPSPSPTPPATSSSSNNEGSSEDKLGALLNIAMSCVSLAPENRPTMRDVLRMIRETRAEAHVSSNSSDHSPGRWSDTVQSLPRDDQILTI